MNRFARNFISLFLGGNLSSLFQIISMWLAIRALGNEQNGILVMVQTYSYLMSDIMNMETFSSVIKYVTDSVESSDIQKAKQYIKLGFMFDLITGLLSVFLGVILYGYITRLMNWNSSFDKYLLVYLPTALLRNTLTGTATGILRYLDDFQLTIRIKVVISFVTILVYLVFSLCKFHLMYFLVSQVALEMCTYISLILFSINRLKRTELSGFHKEKINLKVAGGFLVFNFYNGLSLSFDLLLGHVSNMFLSRVLGFSAVSIYQTIQRIGNISLRFTTPILQIVYPEMCSNISRGMRDKAMKLFTRFVLITSPLCVVFFLIVLVFSKQWMMLFKINYGTYFNVTMLYLAFALFNTITSPVHPLMTALGYVRQNATNTFILNTLYIISLYSILKRWGIEGFVILQLIQSICMVIVKYLYIIRPPKWIKTNDSMLSQEDG